MAHSGSSQNKDGLDVTVNAYFHEFAEVDGTHGPRLPFERFCHFLSHTYLLSCNFHHGDGLDVFLQGLADPESANADTIMMDRERFLAILKSIAMRLYRYRGASGNLALTSSIRQEVLSLQELLRNMNLKREALFNAEDSVLRGAMYNAEVVRAVYRYSGALQSLFHYYATSVDGESCSGTSWTTIAENRDNDVAAVGCRSMVRLCRATRLVPDRVVAGELTDVARSLVRKGSQAAVQHRYLEEQRMSSGVGDDEVWQQPDTSPALPGEPRYNFPEFAEFFVAAALCAPPQMYFEPPSSRIARIDDVFANALRLPCDVQAFDVPAYLESFAENRNEGAKRRDSGLPLRAMEIFAELDDDLPDLLPPRDIQLPGPRPGQILRPQPPTAEEAIEEARKKAAEAAAAKARGKGPLTRRKKVSAEKKREKTPAHSGPVVWEEVVFYERRPQPTQTAIPKMWQREHCSDHLEQFEGFLRWKAEAARGLNIPAQGTVQRMTLVDEPLVAPPCPESEEVSTLIETALASRRLRRYDVAIALLIRARRLWARVAAGRPVPLPWGHIQEMVAAPSPWGCGGTGGMSATSVAAPDSPSAGEEAASIDLLGDISPASRRHEGDAEADAKEAHNGAQYDPRHDFAAAMEAEGVPDATARWGHSKSIDQSDTGPGLRPEVGLYFMCELASLHSAIRHDDLAIQLLWQARRFTEKLPREHPDRAILWCGFGRIAFHTERIDIAARAFSRARLIRERTIGGDTIEAATAYNNLACCFTLLDRVMEAAAYLELASEILKTLAGEDHPRTQAVMRNLDKARVAPKRMIVETPHLFSYNIPDIYANVGRGRTKKKKRKGKGSRGSSKKSSRSSSRKSSTSSKKSGGKKKKGGKPGGKSRSASASSKKSGRK